MKTPFLLASMIMFAVPAAACVPPPGLSPQQWYSMCRADMEQGYALGVGGHQSHDAFMQSMYRMYRSARPTYNPQLEQQQRDLAVTMKGNHDQYMDQVQQEQINRNNAWADRRREGDWNHNNEMLYINNQHCVLWDTAHTFCISAAN